MIKIISLSKFPDYAPILAHWSFKEWYLSRDIDFDIVVKSYIERAKNDMIPCTFIAVSGSMPVGMVSLKKNDLWTREDLNPWLASLYVLPEYRNRGIGDMLVTSIIKMSGECKLNRIYLFIGINEQLNLESYYLKRGWTFFSGAIDNDGKESKIFCYDIM